MTEAAVRPWNERLREPFPENMICAKPRVWCGACRQAEGRVCQRHQLISCSGCKQRITDAHLHLDYVGHADVTDRLLAVDPRWDWYPAYTNPDRDVLLAAIATGDLEIVQAVINNAPPLVDGQGGMWIKLGIHDDDGQIVERLAYGDAEGKTGLYAMKERIGDAIRNGAMRQGVALEQWSKADRDEDTVREGEPLPGPKPPAGPRGNAKDHKTGAQPQLAGKTADPEQETGGTQQAQDLADKAWSLATWAEADPVKLLEQLKIQVHDVAHSGELLAHQVNPPWPVEGSEPAGVRLSTVITRAKQELTARQKTQAGEQS